jgi:hypothetical protein
MAAYPPPTLDLPIFDDSVFTSANNVPLTITTASQYFLRFPNAQGTEYLQDTYIDGLATFNASALFYDAGGTTSIIQNGADLVFTPSVAGGGLQTTTIQTYPEADSQNLATIAYVNAAAGGPSGDVFLSATQTFTGVNTFNNAGGIVMSNSATTATTTSIFQNSDTNCHIASSIVGGGLRLTDPNVGATLAVNSNGLTINKGLQIGNTIGTNIVQMVADPTTNNQLNITGAINVSNTQSYPQASSQILATLSYVNSAISGLTNLLTSNNIWTGTNAFNTSTPTTTITQTYPQSTNTTQFATIAYVNSAAAGGANTTYTQVFTGNFNSGSSITIPTGCIGFNCSIIGTGGTPLSYFIGVPDATHIDYYYQIPATAGGAQVSISNGRIGIPKQLTYNTSTLQIFTNVAGTNGGTVSQLVLNGNILAEAKNGNPPVSSTQGGSATTGTPYSNPNYTSFTTFQGGVGQANNESYTTMNVGQLGGGNIGGGIAGNGQTGSVQNQYGAGGLWGSLGGPSYGMPIVSASPITYGGCIITWFL